MVDGCVSRATFVGRFCIGVTSHSPPPPPTSLPLFPSSSTNPSFHLHRSPAHTPSSYIDLVLIGAADDVLVGHGQGVDTAPSLAL